MTLEDDSWALLKEEDINNCKMHKRMSRRWRKKVTLTNLCPFFLGGGGGGGGRAGGVCVGGIIANSD
jgi:hypothetical protein